MKTSTYKELGVRGVWEHANKTVKVLTEECTSLLDIGCGRAPHTKDFLGPKLHVDLDDWSTECFPFLQIDARKIYEVLPYKSYSATICMDFIEHLNKEDGLTLIKDLEIITKHVIAYFTPLGPLWLGDDPTHTGHHSAWYPKDFLDLGYNVWSWPSCHEFEDGSKCGAFWAYKCFGKELYPEELEALVLHE